jgi:ketosteroid isomerase-like protein
VSQTLSGAIEATQARLARGIAEAEEELARARARCRELRQALALERARVAAAETAPPVEQPKEPAVRAQEQRARIAELTSAYLTTTAAGRPIPKRWLPALLTILRLDTDRFERAFARNTVLYWSGSGPVDGLHLGADKAIEVATRVAQRIQPRSIIVEELTEADDNLDVVARATFANPASGLAPFETTVHCVFRFDDSGRIALLYATPYDGDALEPYLS